MWETIPKAFTVETEPFAPIREESLMDDPDKEECPQRSAWQPRGTYLGFFGGSCVASLYLNVNLVSQGFVLTEYQYADEDVIFELQIDDDKCNPVVSAYDKNRWPALTAEGNWTTHKVRLQAGHYKLNWRAVAASSRSIRPLLIKSILIQGTTDLSQCVLCPAGSYSTIAGSSDCRRCPVNQVSSVGSIKCRSCPNDEYANEAQTECVPRPACTAADYYEEYSKCDGNNKTTVSFNWFSPKVCRDDLAESDQLPVEKQKRDCPPCNPGMEFSAESGECEFCRKGWYSDGYRSCKKCPSTTAANTGLFFSRWNSDLPPVIESKCISFEGSGCSKAPAWQTKNDFIHSSQSHRPDVYLVLSIKLDGGFNVNPRKINQGPVGAVTFTFETKCKHDCEFVFMTASPNHGINVIRTWTGTQEKQNLTFSVLQNDSYVFSWAFQKLVWDFSRDKRGSIKKHLHTAKFRNDDEVRIYNIEILNTIQGGATSCIKCLKGADSSSCTTCPRGKFFQISTAECVACPDGTVAAEAMSLNEVSCEMCINGLVPVEGRTKCGSDCMPKIDGVGYNISSIGRSYKEVLGSRLFTSAGIQYSHVFNISICGITPVTCRNNATLSPIPGGSKSVTSLICRSTLIPNSSGDPASTQVVNLADKLLGFSRKPQLNGIQVLEEFIQNDERKSDLYAFYTSSTVTRTCPKGRATTVTLRCNPKESLDGAIELPSRCPDGTCDGCNFHFLWTSSSNCPLCSSFDYMIVKGECISGKQTVHYIPSKSCQFPSNGPTKKILPCTSQIPVTIQLIIVVAITSALLLCLILLCVWKRTRRLEYKYMKLVASAKPNTEQDDGLHDMDQDAELEAAESCALEEGEDEEVSITIPVRSAKILRKIRSTYQKRAENGSFETIKLTDPKM
ncbi:hypothetical protein QYM36_006154 [Artemia franciscana]|nr:hypothetical protein QYM36_006154 [Artemia franciscana]KAK2719039.1 hypothetical protein QYM36_006154 [Artemia franciscana]